MGRSKKIDVKRYSHWSTEEEKWSNYRIDIEMRFSKQYALDMVKHLITAIQFADERNNEDVVLHLFQYKED